jgi:hypothetical protein
MINIFFEIFNHLVIKDFWIVKIWPYFQIRCNLFIFFNFFISKYFLGVHLSTTWCFGISITLIYLSANVHIVYFIALQISLLKNLTLSLCIVCEFGIDVTLMFISWHQHCAQLIRIFECIVHRHRWISTALFFLNASNYVHTLHYV